MVPPFNTQVLMTDHCRIAHLLPKNHKAHLVDRNLSAAIGGVVVLKVLMDRVLGGAFLLLSLLLCLLLQYCCCGCCCCCCCSCSYFSSVFFLSLLLFLLLLLLCICQDISMLEDCSLQRHWSCICSNACLNPTFLYCVTKFLSMYIRMSRIMTLRQTNHPNFEFPSIPCIPRIAVHALRFRLRILEPKQAQHL